MAKLVVFGANGATGRVIVDEAIAAGHQVTAAVRRPNELAEQDGPTVVRADVRDAADVRAAVAEADAVVSAIGPSGRKAAGLYSAAAETFVAALADRPRRFVMLSSSGVRRGYPNHPWWYRILARTVMGELYGDLRRAEHLVAGSPLEWTFVRPGRIVDQEPTGEYRVLDGGSPPDGRPVSRVDLARFVVGCVDGDSWVRRRPTVAG